VLGCGLKCPRRKTLSSLLQTRKADFQ
jgi:hypothetical protein